MSYCLIQYFCLLCATCIVWNSAQVVYPFFYQRSTYPRDCKEALASCQNQSSNGVYLIKPDGYYKHFEVYCDNRVDSGGWTVILRRHDGSVTFQRDWQGYKLGFGFLSQELWLGNEKLSFLTNQKIYELRIDFTYSDGSSMYALYTFFRISDVFSKYKLSSAVLHEETVDFTECPTNMEYGNCLCQSSCGHFQDCQTCPQDEACFCPSGFYLRGKDCVTREECGCYIDGNVLTEAENETAVDCSRWCTCDGGQLLCDYNYQCSSNAVCEQRNNVVQCYCNTGYEGNGVICTQTIPIDCLEIFNGGETMSGIYTIQPEECHGGTFEVYCNMTDGGGWTVFQRRLDGVIDFQRIWGEYREGFGSQDQEHWLGNEKLFCLTNQRRYALRIDLVDSIGSPYHAKYDFFRINTEDNNYRLTVESYIDGNAGDSLTANHNGEDFSTRDRDNDGFVDFNLATTTAGPWWYGDMAKSSLNGDGDTIRWLSLPGFHGSIRYVEMKVRPVQLQGEV